MHQEIYDQHQVQQDLQTQSSEQQMVYNAPQMAEQVAQAQAVILSQTNPDKILNEIMLKLQGLRMEPNGSLTKESEPLMNQQGIARMKFVLSGFLNQSTVLSHLDEKEISKLVIYLHDNVARDLATNWRFYEIQDKATLNHIEGSIIVPAFLALKRALGQNEKNWLGRVTVENITGRPGIAQPRKEGLLSKFRL